MLYAHVCRQSQTRRDRPTDCLTPSGDTCARVCVRDGHDAVSTRERTNRCGNNNNNNDNNKWACALSSTN